MPVRLNGSTSGYTELSAPAVAGNNTLTLPTGNGTSGQVLSTNGSGALSWTTVTSPAVALTAATAVASTSGTSIDFTGIPSGVKRITVILQSVSSNGSSHKLIQLGTSGGITTSGYVCSYGYFTGAGATFSATSGFGAYTGAGGEVQHGNAIITNISGNNWVFSYSGGVSGSVTLGAGGGGSVTLSGALTQVRITNLNGTDTFDLGSVNIMYEG